MKNKICLWAGIMIIILQMLMSVSATAKLLCVFTASIFLWITTPIEIGSLICLVGLMTLPGVKPATVFEASFGNSTIMFLIFSMLLTYGLSETGLLRRIAIWFINNPLAKKNERWLMGLYFLAMLVIGSFIAPTTLFVLFFGIVNEIYDCMDLEKGDELARRMMIGTGFFASISCAMTPIAHTFPIMALGYYETATGNAISYGEYMKYSIPIGIILSICAFIILIIGLKNEKEIKVYFSLPKITKKEIISGIVFAIVILWWIIVGIWPKKFTTLNALGTVFSAMLGCIILAATECLHIKHGMTNGVSWSAILLCAATLALGKVLTIEDFGIIPMITSAMGTKISIFMVIIFAIILTNLISNIVTTTLSFNIFVPAMIAGTVSCNPIVATIAIGIGASLAYALPSSIAHIALAGSSGWANTKDMIKYGIIMMIFSIIVMGVII